MKSMKKLAALLLAIVMLLAVWSTATAGETTPAPETLGNGEVGGFTSPDNPISKQKSIILKKEITAYNLDEEKVNAPTITYSYAITNGTANVNVTDEDGDHATGVGAITVPTKAGVGSPTITSSISWATSEELNASKDGTANTKDIIVDFSGVAFNGVGNGAGIYRYKITETLADGFSYAATGVTEGNNNHVRFLDVYVRPANPTPEGKEPANPEYWDIYGYVCVDDGNNGATAVNPSTTKTNGFVDSDSSTTVSTADKYYTYNLTISKTVENDAYAAATHKFPFTVIFTNNDINQKISLKTTTTGTVADFARVDGAPTWSGVAELLSGGSIKYIGIPMGTDVEVYETNDITGATYTVLTTRNNATTETGTDYAVTDGSKPGTALTQAGEEKEGVWEKTNAYESTKTIIDTTRDKADENAHTVAITNTLLNISPTGVVLRIAPYALMLGAGIALFIVFAVKRRKNDEEEET